MSKLNQVAVNSISRVERAITDLAAGKHILIQDASNRENEADLVMAASFVDANKVGFMVRYTSGMLCVPMESSLAKHLRLPLMVQENQDPRHTSYTVTVDKVGLSTGISAYERSETICALSNPNSTAEDFVRPGHVFPIISHPLGLSRRKGHTEATVDLLKLANLSPCGVIGELVNDDGSIKKGQEVIDFSQQYNILHVSIEEIVAYFGSK